MPKVGGTKDPDLVQLRDAARRRISSSTSTRTGARCVDAARAFVPQVIVTHPLAPTDNPRLYRLFGAIFDREREAEALVAGFTAALARLDAAAARCHASGCST